MAHMLSHLILGSSRRYPYGPASIPSRRSHPGRPAGRPGRQTRFLRAGRKLPAVLDGLHDADIQVTVCRQEGGAAMMADAHGKLTGEPGICMVTRGPGASNALAGVHIAKQDSTPLILFVGQIERGMREREAFQEMDYRAVFGTQAKWVTEIDQVERIPELVSRAFHIATSGRPGPVVIALPEDMLVEAAAVADAALRAHRRRALGRPAGRPGTTAGQGHPARRHPGRQPLERAGRAAVRRVRRAPRAADLGVVPAPDAVPGRPSLLHRRRGPGHQPGAAQARGRRRPDPAGRRPHVRKPQPGLHPAGHPGAAPEAGPCASRQRRAGARVPPHAGDQYLARRFRRGAGRPEGAGRPACRRHPRHARVVPEMERPAAIRTPGALQMGEVMAYLEKRCRPTPS